MLIQLEFMKLLCIILSFYTLTLSTVPCCPDDTCDDEVEATHADNHEQTHVNDEFSSCSQFLSCGNCSGFVVRGVDPYIAFLIIEISNPFSYLSSTNDFPPNIWQPPQLS